MNEHGLTGGCPMCGSKPEPIDTHHTDITFLCGNKHCEMKTWTLANQ